MQAPPSVIINVIVLQGLNRYWRKVSLGAVLLGVAGAGIVSAVSTMTEGYTLKGNPQPLGALVSLEKDTTDTVVPASTDTVDNLFGVIVTGDSSLLSVSNGATNEVQVATASTEDVLISDINGTVKRGDHITASPIPGVGMKATANVRVIGVAQSNSRDVKKQKVKNKDGSEQEISIGQIAVLVNPAYFFQQPEKTIIPAAIQNVANALAGREVKTLPILISAAIFIVTLIVVVSIAYSMIRNSIISVGRNPMSQSAVYRDLIQMSALVLAILAAAVAAMYFVLTKL